jgi:hypothetical protein
MQSPNFNFFNEIEKIELAEDVFGTNVLLNMAFDNPHEIVDYLVLQLRGWGPNPFASDFLKQLATKRNSRGLAQGLHDSWRREQIAAVIQEIFNIDDLSTGGDEKSPLHSESRSLTLRAFVASPCIRPCVLLSYARDSERKDQSGSNSCVAEYDLHGVRLLDSAE